MLPKTTLVGVIILKSSVLLLDFCANYSLSIMNSMFEHENVHECMWHQDSLDSRLLMDFAIA